MRRQHLQPVDLFFGHQIRPFATSILGLASSPPYSVRSEPPPSSNFAGTQFPDNRTPCKVSFPKSSTSHKATEGILHRQKFDGILAFGISFCYNDLPSHVTKKMHPANKD
ncbi:uncharacterized protein LOC143864213 isoform X2 [Tasmannia lanceolata]|uniref:uncharacterized protein LOC143864213 isoform X2 n=1 Tax=Tasmannia lanceolata TaxID=3420 RepID=UPI004062D952